MSGQCVLYSTVKTRCLLCGRDVKPERRHVCRERKPKPATMTHADLDRMKIMSDIGGADEYFCLQMREQI